MLVAGELSGDDLVKFYYERGLAARDIGKVRRQLADLGKAESLSRGSSGITRLHVLYALSKAEVLGGNYTDAIQHRQAAVDMIPPNRRGMLISRGASLAVLYAWGGDLNRADDVFAEAEAAFGEAQS